MLFQPFKPMLASREQLQHITQLMQGKFYVEQKIDGERIQLHKKDKTFRYWSRNSKEFTYLYQKSLTPFICDSCFSENVNELILDGEMVSYDPVADNFQPFGTLKSAALERIPFPSSRNYRLVHRNGKRKDNKPFIT